ncbi:hypothetical protein EMCRGX_G030282 [Ephydatia muelleri]
MWHLTETKQGNTSSTPAGKNTTGAVHINAPVTVAIQCTDGISTSGYYFVPIQEEKTKYHVQPTDIKHPFEWTSNDIGIERAGHTTDGLSNDQHTWAILRNTSCYSTVNGPLHDTRGLDYVYDIDNYNLSRQCTKARPRI